MSVLYLCWSTTYPNRQGNMELQKTIFLSLLKFLEVRFCGKKLVTFVKFQIATNCINPKFHLNAILFSHSTGVRGYFHDISMIYPWFTWYLQVIFMLFVFFTCRAHNLAENKTNLVENLKNVGFRRTHGTRFLQVWNFIMMRCLVSGESFTDSPSWDQ